MKHKLLIGLIVALSLTPTATVTNQSVQAVEWQKNEASWDGAAAVITTKKVKIIKKNVAKKYSHSYKIKYLRKGSKIKVYPDAYHKNWVLFKKGYTHKGYIPNGNKYQPKRGYYWIIKKNWLNDNWFKMNPDLKFSWNFWSTPHTVKITKQITASRGTGYESFPTEEKILKVGDIVQVYHQNQWPPCWRIISNDSKDKWTGGSYENDTMISSKSTDHDWFKLLK